MVLKVFTDKSTKRAKPPHPKPESGKALRDGIKQLEKNYEKGAHDQAKRPEHRR